MATDVDKAEAQMNLTALQQFDPYISHILMKASQVALYLFNHAAKEWEKTDIQGTMFVYERSATPFHGFMIMNRLSLHNLTEPITKDLDYTLQEPFLLYKTAKAICGIWFYNRNDCVRFAELIQRLLVKIREEEEPVKRSMSTAVPTDIMSMLNKAQHEYKQGTKKKRSASESGPSPIGPSGDGGGAGVIRPIPLKVSPGHTSKTDDQLAGRGGAKPKTSPMGPRFQRSVSMQDTKTTTTATPSTATATSGGSDGSKVIPVLQRLMSQGTEERPVITEKGQIHTLESLEKMHSTLPTEGAATGSAGKKPEVQSLESIESLHLPSGGASEKRPSAAAAGTGGAPSSAESSQHLQRLLLRLQSGSADTASGQGMLGTVPSGAAGEPSQERPVPEKLPPSSPNTDMNQALLNKLKSGTTAPAVNLLKPSSTTLTPNILASQSAEPSRVPPAMKQLFPTPKESRKTPSPPNTIHGVPSNLLTPELLRTRSTSESSSTLLSPLKLSGSVQAGQGQPAGKRTDPSLQRGAVLPLTKEQLADTLIYLLKTDDDFLCKIHSAYSQSLQRLPP